MEAPCPAWNAGYARQSGLASALTRMLAPTGEKNPHCNICDSVNILAAAATLPASGLCRFELSLEEGNVSKPKPKAKSAKPKAAKSKVSRPAAAKAKSANASKHAAKPAPKPAKPAKPAPKLAKPSGAVSGKSIMESAQQIWLAGLGAFAKAQEQGGSMFETLLKEGSNIEQKTRKLASGKVDDVRDAVESGVTQVRERTQETWDRLEQVFEDRVSRALAKLGVPGKKELDDLLKRVDELNRDVRKLTGGGLRPGLTQVMNNTVRRARDDLSDLARELEDAQLAAKQTMKRTVAQVKKAVKSARR
jgi:poly(hydroxyalkanoate) granule-associated protein